MEFCEMGMMLRRKIGERVTGSGGGRECLNLWRNQARPGKLSISTVRASCKMVRRLIRSFAAMQAVSLKLGSVTQAADMHA
jgi:hypothetical protein